MRIQGKIIRILDKRTVIINLGKNHGIADHSIFSIIGDPESVVDPFTKEELGLVSVVKAKVKAVQVHDKFTIASTKWIATHFKLTANIGVQLGGLFDQETVDEGELLVSSMDVQPWKAKSETPVKVGDIVEVEVPTPPKPKTEIAEGKTNLKSEELESPETPDKEVPGDREGTA